MKKNYILLFLFSAFGLLSMDMQCYRDYSITPYTYQFAEKVMLYPYKKQYSINDTIWVEYRTADKSMYDKLSRSRINTDTTTLSQYIYYHKRYPSSSLGDIFCSTVVVGGANPVFGTPIWYNTLKLESECSSRFYFLKAGFVPKTTGIYSLELPANSSLVRCPNKISSIYCSNQFTFDLADCNKDVYLSIPPNSRSGERGFVDVRIDNKEYFVFKVE